MSVGFQATTTSIGNNISQSAISLRGVMNGINDLNTQVNGQGNGITYLANIGFSTVPSTVNPGGVSDAQYALNMIAYLNTLAGVYYGTVQQGGSNGTAATMFNFDNELSQVWGGQ